MKKTILFLLACCMASVLFAQTKVIYGNFTKTDGSRIKGTSVMKGYEDQLIINNYTGGSDNTGTIEIEVPTVGYMATFRDLMNAAQVKPQLTKLPTATTKPVNTNPIATNPIANAPERKMPSQVVAPAPTTIARAVISVTNRVSNNLPRNVSQVILENITVESCTDNPSTGMSIIKLKATRIGWIYYNTDPRTGLTTAASKTGWDVAAGKAWSDF